jgi:hypothetical protein
MKYLIKSLFLALIGLTVLLSGCAPAAIPVPPTAMPEPTPIITPIPSPTAIVQVWKQLLLIDSPFVYSNISSRNYNFKKINRSDIAFESDTRWAVNIQVDKLNADVGEASTGIQLIGLSGSKYMGAFILVYQNGLWSIGVKYNQKDIGFPYWENLKTLVSPVQSFEISISHDGMNISIKNDKGFELHHTLEKKLFDGAKKIEVGAQAGPRTKITLSKLVVERLIVPAE